MRHERDERAEPITVATCTTTTHYKLHQYKLHQ
jgi:hypothetical protein